MDQVAYGDPNDLLNTAELSAEFGVSKQWTEIGRSRGYGPPFVRLGPRCIRYRRKDVLRWLESRVYARTADYKNPVSSKTTLSTNRSGRGGAS